MIPHVVCYCAGQYIYMMPDHAYRLSATPRPSDCVWIVPGTQLP
jgi:hypothetical protein